MELIVFIGAFIILFWIGVKLNRWVNGSSKIAKNQNKILEELRKQNEFRSTEKVQKEEPSTTNVEIKKGKGLTVNDLYKK